MLTNKRKAEGPFWNKSALPFSASKQPPTVEAKVAKRPQKARENGAKSNPEDEADNRPKNTNAH